AVVLAVTLGWRIPEADERAGIDLSHHAEAGYDLGGALAARRERSSRAASVPLPHPMDLEPRNPLPTGAGAGAPAAKAGHHPAATARGPDPLRPVPSPPPGSGPPAQRPCPAPPPWTLRRAPPCRPVPARGLPPRRPATTPPPQERADGADHRRHPAPRPAAGR